MTTAILFASVIAALAAVGGIAYQLYVRRPVFACLGGATNPDSIYFDIKNIGSTAARRVAVRARIDGVWYDVQQAVLPVLTPDQTQSFSCVVPEALQKNREVVAVSYTGALGRRWTRTISMT